MKQTAEVKVTAKGNLDPIADSANRAAKGVKNLRNEVKSTTSAIDSLEEHTRANGVLGTGSAGQNFSKLSRTMKGESHGIVAAYATLAANVFSITAAFTALKNAAQVQQVEAGLVSIGSKMGVTLSVVAKNVRDLSGGMLTLEQSMRSTAQVVSAGFGTQELQRLASVAKDASFALGRDMQESMDRLTRGVIKLEPELIDELGIMVRLDDANKEYARALNKSASQLTLTEKRQAFLNATLAEGELKFGGVSKAGEGLNGLQQLAATFQDLTKEIMNFINIAAIPLAKIFSFSPGALLGAIVLFGGTIVDKLLPGLASLEKAALKTAETMKNSLTAEIRAFDYSGKENKGVVALREKMEAGTATIMDYKVQIRDLQAEIQYLEQSTGRLQSKNTGQFINKEKAIQEKQILVSSLEELTRKSYDAQIAQTSSNAIVAASTGNLNLALKELQVSWALNNEAMLTNAASGRVLGVVTTRLSLAWKNFALTIKVAGAALLQAIPLIGQLILGVSLLWDGLKWSYEAIVGKEVVKARKELTEINKAVGEKWDAYNKLRESSASLASKEVAMAKNISNSITEQTDALKALNAELEKRRQGVKKVSEEEFKYSDLMKKTEGVGARTGDAGVDALISQYKQANPEIRKQIDQIVTSIEGGWKTVIRNGDLASKALYILAERLGEVGAQMEAVTISTKELDNAYTDFIKSATPTTPYDNLVLNLGKTRKSVVDLSLSASEGKATTKQLAGALTSLGQTTLSQLSDGSRKFIEDLKELDRVQNSIREASRVPVNKMTGEQAWNLMNLKVQEQALNRSINIDYTKRVTLLTQELIQQESIFSNLQEQHLLYAGQLALAQAHLATVSSYNDLSGKGTADRMKAENAVKAIQASQLRTQAEILVAMIRQLEIQMDILNASKETNLQELEKLGIIIKQSTLKELVARLDSTENKEAKAKLNEAIRLESERLDIENRRRQALAGAKSLQSQAAAATANSNSKQLIAAASAETFAKTQAENAARAIEITKAQLALDNSKVELAREYSQEQKTVLDTYNEVIAQQEKIRQQEINNITKASEARIRALETERQKAADRGNDPKTQALYSARIEQEKVSLSIALEQFEITQKIERAKALQLRTEEQQAQVALDSLNKQLDALDKINSSSLELLKTQQEIIELERKIRGLPELNPIEKVLEAQKLAKAEEEAAQRTAQIKRAIIAAEYALLGAQLRESLRQANARNTALELARSSEPRENVGAIQSALDTLGDAEDMALQAFEANLRLTTAKSVASGLVQGLSGVGMIDVAKLPIFQEIEAGSLTEALANSFEALSKTDPTMALRAGLIIANETVTPFIEKFKELGPNGEATAALVQGSLLIVDSFLAIKQSVESLSESFKMLNFGSFSQLRESFNSLSTEDKENVLKGIADIATSASSILGQINNIYQSSAKAKIDAIDKQIAAEQKRDGKSADSLSKIQAMEKKKESIQKKAFDVNKKLMIAQAVMSTAAGVAGALAAPFGLGIPLAALVAAMGAAQVALIASTNYESTSTAAAAATPTSIAIGKRSSAVDLAKSNSTPGGELGYLSGSTGYGSNASNFTRRAYGGPARAGMIVGEKGPEIFVPSVPGNIVSNDAIPGQSINANISIQAIDAEGVEEVLTNNRGHIISMLREAANSNGQTFLESVNTQKYRRGGNKL